MMPIRLYRRRPEGTPATTSCRSALMLLTLLLCASTAWAQPGRSQVAEGNRLYQQEQFEEARQRYLQALREAPESPIPSFNQGNALYRLDNYQEALQAYQQAVQKADPGLQSKAWYNLGNAFFRQQNLDDAIESYKQSLRLDPSDQDAKYNLEMALRQKKEQEDQQNQQQDQENQDQQQQDQDQQKNDQQQNQQQDQQDQNQQQDQQDQNQQQDQQQQDQQEDPEQQQQQQDQQQQGQDEQKKQEQQQPQEGEGEPLPMSPETAAQLLQAIREDPKEIRRKQLKPKRPVKVEKDW